jgi:CrcB protein
MRAFLVVGMLGAFTTFSTFSLDVVTLYERGEWGLAAAYVVLSLVLSVLALFVGMSAMRAIFA